ncbi:RDD family protein [Microvirga flavescens]|uniref:RDD family protein n=1 Tax=Microvirga flavescens TaxID=2249811 RepID=UPI000DDA9AB7|nr:RDD family protein [Microvirga flavescens]
MTGGPVVQSTIINAYEINPRLTRGVISRRFWAYIVDIVMIAIWSVIVSIGIFMFGLLTIGFGWVLFSLVPLTAIAYNALTIGGRSQATVGMRVMGLRAVDTLTGGPVHVITAAVHALLFYVAVGTFALWALDILIGLFRNDSRFGHDLLTGITVIRP